MNKYNDKGERHGPWQKRWGSGNLMYKGNFVHGKLSGLYKTYNSNGKLCCKVNYVNGKKCGLEERYWFNGNLNIKQYNL